MNAQTAPRLSALLGQVATQVKITTTSLGLNRLDKEASKMSDRDHNARQGTGKTYASRMSGAEHLVKAIASKAAEGPALLNDLSTAYNGQRLLPNDLMQKFLGEFGRIKAEYDRMVDQFIAAAPTLIADAQQNKGTYRVDVPSLQEIEEAFSLEFTMSQIPDSSTYQGAGLDAAMNAEMQRRFEDGVKAAYHNAQQDALKRVAEPIGHLISRLTEFSKIEEQKARGLDIKSARLYESTITNVQDIAKVFSSFNLTGDALMDKVAEKLNAFEGVEIDDLKNSDALRKHIAAKAEDILADLKDLI
jgi:hypothetical protein